MNPFRATVIIGKLDDSDAGKVKICIEDSETLKIEGMSDHKSRNFINNYCMKRYGINPQDSLVKVTKNHTKKLDSLALTKFSETLLDEESMEEAVLSAWEKKKMKEMDHETFAGLAFEILHQRQKMEWKIMSKKQQIVIYQGEDKSSGSFWLSSHRVLTGY